MARDLNLEQERLDHREEIAREYYMRRMAVISRIDAKMRLELARYAFDVAEAFIVAAVERCWDKPEDKNGNFVRRTREQGMKEDHDE